MDDAELRMSRARNYLIFNAPFFATCALQMPLVADPTCRTMWTDGRVVGYNPTYVTENLTEDEVVAVLCEEYEHNLFGHPARREDRDPRKWNKGCDQVVWENLSKAGYSMPADSFYSPEFDGMDAESVYAVLMGRRQAQEPQPENTGGGDDGEAKQENKAPGDDQDEGGEEGQEDSQGEEGTPRQDNARGVNEGIPEDISSPSSGGEVRDLLAEDGSGPASGSERQRFVEEQMLMMQSALNAAKAQGNVPAGMEILVKKLLEPRIPWREVLVRWFQERYRDDYSWRRPNKNYLQQGIYMPSLSNETLGTVAVMRDTSGSTVAEMDLLTTELASLLGTFNVELVVIDVDADVQGITWARGEEEALAIKAKGGGGTDFRPGFKWLEDEGVTPVGVVYLTDGECDKFPDEPGFDTLWVLTKPPTWMKWAPPFGETIYMDNGR